MNMALSIARDALVVLALVEAVLAAAGGQTKSGQLTSQRKAVCLNRRI